MKKAWGMIFLVSVAAAAAADQVEMQDGSVLKGRILSISETVIELETAYADTVKVARARVASFATDETIFLRLTGGTVVPGPVLAGDGKELILKGPDGDLKTDVTLVKEGWRAPDQDPALLDLQRKWRYRAEARISGKSGNTSEENVSAAFDATLAAKKDELKFYMLYSRSESEGVKTTDERKGGVRYTSYFHEPWGWYLRSELENDEFENIRMRSTTAGGLSYRFWNEKHKKLSASAGVSYRYEDYYDASDSEGAVGLDFGLQNYYRFKNRFEIHNELSYVPSVEDAASYLIAHESWMNFPLGDSEMWKIRMGLRNDYNAAPKGGRDRLDNTYYTGLVVDWE